MEVSSTSPPLPRSVNLSREIHACTRLCVCVCVRAWTVAAECTSSRTKPDIPEVLRWRSWHPTARIVPWEFPSIVRFLHAAATKVHACTRLRTRLRKGRKKRERDENRGNTSEFHAIWASASFSRSSCQKDISSVRRLIPAKKVLRASRYRLTQIDPGFWQDTVCKVGMLSRELRIRDF